MAHFFSTRFARVYRTFGFDNGVGGLDAHRAACIVDVCRRMKAGEAFEITRTYLLEDDYFVFACGLVVRLAFDGRDATLLDVFVETKP
jgi:hypothetical protein